MKKDPTKGIVDYTQKAPPSAANSPRVVNYAEGVASRMAAKGAIISKGGEARGGPPAPPIPRLDQPVVAGSAMTMAEHAQAQKAQAEAQANFPITNSLQRQPVDNPLGLLMTDLLPPEAMQDPEYRAGGGAQYAAYQPHLAAKYGIIRGQTRISARELNNQSMGRKGGLSEKTIQGLQKLAEYQNTTPEQPTQPSGDTGSTIFKDPEDYQAEAAAARSSKDLGNMQPPNPNPGPVGVERDRLSDSEVQKVIQNMDEFDWETFRDLLQKDLLNNDSEREAIEERLEPLRLDELVMGKRAIQNIPVNPGVFEFKLQSYSGAEELALKNLVMMERKTPSKEDRYYHDKYRFMVLTMGLHSVNGNILPGFTDNDGEFNPDLFYRKLNYTMKYNFHLLASVGAHFHWFDIRVRKLFTVKRLKNG